MIDVKKLRELAKEAPRGPYISDGDGIRALVRDDLGRIIAVRHRLDGSEHQAVANYFAAVDPQTILALCDRLEAMEHEREDQNRYLAAQSAEISGLKQRLAQQPSGEVTDYVRVPARVVELLAIINRDGVIKRASELREVYRLINAARAGEKQ